MILVIDRRDTILSLEGGSVVVRVNGIRQNAVPVGLLTQIIIARKTALDSSLLASLSDDGIMITLFGGRYQEKAALVLGQNATLAQVRRSQYKAAFDSDISLTICRLIISGKTRAQKQLVGRFLEASPASRYSLTKALNSLSRSQQALRFSTNVDSIRGIEGANAAQVFDALKHVVPPRLNFNRRVRRPPPDPVNALLSLTYTILHHTAVQCCNQVGLDPLCGFLHGPQHGRASLASDAIELLRPAADEFVWRCFRNETLRPEHFTYRDEACLLGKTGRGLYYSLIAAERSEWERYITWRLRRLRHYLEASS